MPTFRYNAFTAAGREVAGAIEAENERDALARLKRDGLLPKSVNLAATGARASRLHFNRGVSLPDLALMTRRLATLLASAVPVYEAISTLAEQEREGELRSALHRVKDRLAEGASLAGAMGADSAVFDESYVSMISAGEASGALDLVLERLAEFMEGQQAIRTKAITAMIYPLLMMVVGSGVMLFLLAFVIPKIIVIFESNKASLPILTLVLIKVSGFVRATWWVMILLVILGSAYYQKKLKDENFRLRRDRLLLRLPLVGSLVQKFIVARFGKVLGLLLMSGVPVMKALDITATALVNREYRNFLNAVRGQLGEGGSLSASLKSSLLFPPLMVHMISVGEKSGELEQMLIKGGTAFEKEFEAAMTRSMALLEPLMILAMGLSVGLMVMAVLLPIFELNQLIK